ncbi:MAG: FHA domain-containing protein [Akkermansiaceae bacterium]
MPRVIITNQDQNAQPYRFQLERKVVSLGRGSDNDIVIDSASVSGKHAEMLRVGGGYVLNDLGSTNGIKVDGTRQSKVSLISGMSVKLGDVAFDFSLSEEELELLSHEEPAEVETAGPAPLPDLPEEETTEKPKAKRSPRPPAHAPEPSGVGSGMIWLFIILAAAAFFTGLSIRHQKETGESLIKAIINKSDFLEKGSGEAGTSTPKEETEAAAE